jgi:hypothetical protein
MGREIVGIVQRMLNRLQEVLRIREQRRFNIDE